MAAFTSVNPADLDDVVAHVDLATARGLRRRLRPGPRGAARLGRGARARARPGHRRRSAGWSRPTRRRSPRLVTREVGKPYAEALGEVQEVVDTCDFFLGEGRRLYGQTVPSEMPDKQLFTFRAPVGVAAIITAANFPVAVPSWYLVPALLCGNAVVWKPAEVSAAVGRRDDPALPRRRACPTACCRPSSPTARRRTRGSSRRWRPARSTRSASPARRAVGRLIGEPCAAGTCSRPAWSSAARTRWSSCPTPTSTSPSRARSSPASAPPASGARRSARCGRTRSVYDAFADRLAAAVEAAVVGDPREDVLYGPMISPSVPRPAPAQPRPRAAAPPRARVERGRPDHRRHRRGPASSATPTAGSTRTRRWSRGCGPATRSTARRRSGRSSGWAASARSTRRSSWPTAPATGCRRRSTPATRRRCGAFRAGIGAGMVSVNNSTSGAEAHLPFGGNGKSGNGSRQSGRVGARPVHPLAGDELGLLRPAAEGPDGRRRAALGPGVPALIGSTPDPAAGTVFHSAGSAR